MGPGRCNVCTFSILTWPSSAGCPTLVNWIVPSAEAVARIGEEVDQQQHFTYFICLILVVVVRIWAPIPTAPPIPWPYLMSFTDPSIHLWNKGTENREKMHIRTHIWKCRLKCRNNYWRLEGERVSPFVSEMDLKLTKVRAQSKTQGLWEGVCRHQKGDPISAPSVCSCFYQGRIGSILVFTYTKIVWSPSIPNWRTCSSRLFRSSITPHPLSPITH